MSNRCQVKFDGIEDLMARIERLGGQAATRGAAEAALTRSHEAVTAKLAPISAAHRLTGATDASLHRTPEIAWEGAGLASVAVGFSISGGGLASVFMMHGTPRMAPVRGMLAAVRNTKALGDAQRQAMQEWMASL